MKLTLRRVRHSVTAAVVLPLAALGMTLAAAGANPARATAVNPLITQVFCKTPSSGTTAFCLNDWNNGGSGGAVRMFTTAGVANEGFVEQQTGRCGGTVTSTCPFAVSAFDARYAGFPIVQLDYTAKDLCVGTNSSANAVLTTCNNVSTGFGGGNGTLFVDHNGFMISLYWSNQDQHDINASCMDGAELNGGAVTLNLSTGSGCPTWYSGVV